MDCLSQQPLLLIHLLFLLEVVVFTRTVGVTHWKLQENNIVPASAASSHSVTDGGEAADEFFWSSVSGEDPEFSVLMKRTTNAGSQGGGLGTIAGGAGNRNYGRKSNPRGQHTHQTDGCSSESSSESRHPTDASGTCPEKPAAKSPPRNPDGSGPMLVHTVLGGKEGRIV